MNLESIPIPVFTATILALAAFVLIPVTTMAMSKLPLEASARSADSSDGASCEIPPYVEIEGREGGYSFKGTPPLDKEIPENFQTATFAMGWFWGPDSRYGSLDGVIRTRVGYAGGTRPNPTYRRIGDHMETIQIDYDPEKTTYTQLFKIFLAGHNPTRPSFSRQYASAVFYHDEDQKKHAKEALNKAAARFGKKIATEILPYSGFTRAEDYHQKYYLRNTRAIMEQYKDLFPTEDAFTDSTAVTRVNGYIGGNGSSEQLEKEATGLGLSEGAVDALREILRKSGK